LRSEDEHEVMLPPFSKLIVLGNDAKVRERVLLHRRHGTDPDDGPKGWVNIPVIDVMDESAMIPLVF